MAAGRVVEGLDPGEDRSGEPGTGGPVVPIEEFALEAGEEALGDGVVQRVADGAHRAEQPGVAKALPEDPAAVVRSVIRVGDRTLGWASAPGGHVDGVGDELGAHVISDRPAHDAPGPGVDDDGEVDPALTAAVLGDVLDPQAVRAVGSELAMHQIIRAHVEGPGAGAALRAAAASHPLEAAFAHHPSDALVVDLAAEPEPQLGRHAPPPVGPEALIVDLDDQITEVTIGEHPCRRVDLQVPPGVERRLRHLHRSTRRVDRDVGAAIGDEGVDHFGRTFSLAK